MCIFFLEIVDTLNHTKIFPAAVLLDCEQAPCVCICWMDINNEVLQILQFCLSMVVILQKLAY